MTKLNILVTGVGGRSVGHQILHALLKCGERYNIVTCDAEAFSFGLYLTKQHYCIPRASSADYLEAIGQIVSRESIDVILPGSEPEVSVLSHARATIERGWNCKVIASAPEVIDLCQNKARLYEWLHKNGFGVPISCRADVWRDLVARTGFPIVGKPSTGSGGSRQVELLADEREVEDYIARFAGDRSDIVFQEYVGDADSEYTVGVTLGPGGRVIDSICLQRKLIGLSLGSSRQIKDKVYTLSTGYSQGFIRRDSEIQNLCETLAVRLGIFGPANFQLRRHEGKIKIFEVHPRFSGSTSIRADVGLNEPDLAIRSHALGEKLGRQDYQFNVAALRAFQTIIVPESELLGMTVYPDRRDGRSDSLSPTSRGMEVVSEKSW